MMSVNFKNIVVRPFYIITTATSNQFSQHNEIKIINLVSAAVSCDEMYRYSLGDSKLSSDMKDDLGYQKQVAWNKLETEMITIRKVSPVSKHELN